MRSDGSSLRRGEFRVEAGACVVGPCIIGDRPPFLRTKNLCFSSVYEFQAMKFRNSAMT